MQFMFFNNRRPRPYFHRNIYYDPAKEAHDERQVRVNKELGLEPEDGKFVSSIKRGSFRRDRDKLDVAETRDMQSERRKSNIRLAIICAIMLAIAAFLYFTSSDFRLL